jgi:hypothetical protein
VKLGSNALRQVGVHGLQSVALVFAASAFILVAASFGFREHFARWDRGRGLVAALTRSRAAQGLADAAIECLGCRRGHFHVGHASVRLIPEDTFITNALGHFHRNHYRPRLAAFGDDGFLDRYERSELGH